MWRFGNKPKNNLGHTGFQESCLVNWHVQFFPHYYLPLSCAVNAATGRSYNLAFTCRSYNLAFTCRSYNLEFTCRSYNLAFTCRSYNLAFTYISYNLAFTCRRYNLAFTCRSYNLAFTSRIEQSYYRLHQGEIVCPLLEKTTCYCLWLLQ